MGGPVGETQPAFFFCYTVDMKLRVGVLRGGTGSEYERSLAWGADVLKSLPVEYVPVDVLVDKTGKWHVGGYEIEPGHINKRADVLYSTLENDDDAHVVENVGLPFVGSGKVAKALSRDRMRSSEALRRAGEKTPIRIPINAHEHTADDVFNIFRTTPQPSTVRTRTQTPHHEGAHAGSYESLAEELIRAVNIEPDAVIESHVPGKDIVCIVIEDFRGDSLYTLPSVEVRVDGTVVYPTRLSKDERAQAEDSARKAHRALGARHFSQSHMRVSPRGAYVIDTLLNPRYGEGEALHVAGEAVGVSRADILKHLVEKVLK